jgi:hypothetical protein
LEHDIPALVQGESGLCSFKPSFGIIATLENVDGWGASTDVGNNNNINGHKTPMVRGLRVSLADKVVNNAGYKGSS